MTNQNQPGQQNQTPGQNPGQQSQAPGKGAKNPKEPQEQKSNSDT